MLLALAAPAVSLLPALTTGLRGSAAAVSFPHGYAVTLIATVAVTAAACALGGFISHRAGLVTIPLGLGLWAIAGLGVTAAGLSLGHAHLADWGIVLLTAVAAGAGPACWPRPGDPDMHPPAGSLPPVMSGVRFPGNTVRFSR